MKRVFLAALSLCLTLSFSGLNAADSHVLTSVKDSAAKPLAYETDGVVPGSPGISWHIVYSGTTPISITYTYSGTSYGPYSFFSSSGAYQAGGPRELGIINVTVVNGNPFFNTVF